MDNMRSTIFSGDRFANLLRYEVTGKWLSVLITGGAVAGVLLIINVASSGTANQWNIHSVFYPLTLLLSGLIYASYSFSVLGDRLKAPVYLVLPVSQFEKYLGKFLLSTVGILVFTTLGYLLVSLAGSGITILAFGQAHPIFNPFSVRYVQFLRLFLVNHAVLFFGSVYFRRHAIFKTFLSLFLLSLALSIVAMVLTRLIFLDHFQGITFRLKPGYENGIVFGSGIEPGKDQTVDAFLNATLQIIKIAYWWCLPPFCWILGFIRLRETEA
jgi:hypothetical protein